MKRLFITLLTIAAIACCMNAQSLEPLSMTDCKGKRVELTSLSPRMVTFYYDECIHCQGMMDRITRVENEVYNDLGEEAPLFAVCWKSPNIVIALAENDAEKNNIIKRFDARGWSKGNLYFVDKSKDFWGYLRRYGITRVPVTLEVSRKGKILQSMVGDSQRNADTIYTCMFDISVEI